MKTSNIVKMTSPEEIMEGYMSPVNIIHKHMHDQINIQVEDNIMKAVMKCGIEVDKEELIKALQYDRQQYDKGFNDGCKANTQRWIPCSERLPEDESTIYWTTHEDGSIVMHGYTNKNGFIYNWEVDDLEKRQRQGDVIAWMPLILPEPYKEGDQE